MYNGAVSKIKKEDLFRVEDIALNILVYEDKNEDVWLAHCLELDLVEDGENKLDATLFLLRTIVAQIRECSKDNVPFIHPAPKEYWEKLHLAKPFSLLKELAQQSQFPLRHVVIKELPNVSS